MDDQNTPSEPIAEATVQATEPVLTPIESESSQPNGSTSTDLPPEAPEAPRDAPTPIPVESQNGGVNQPEGESPKEPISAPDEPETPVNDQLISEPVQPVPVQSTPVSAPTPPTPTTPQTQPSAQPLQTPTSVTQPNSSESNQFRNIQARGRTKIQTNRKQKLDKLIQFAQKKQIVDNEEIQVLLRISSATATRYLVELVKQGRLVREGSPRHAKYRFMR